MGFFISGHDESNDDISDQPVNGTAAQEGYAGIGQIGPQPGTYNDPRAWGGSRGQIGDDGYIIPGTSGADEDVDRYRKLGAQQQGPVQLHGAYQGGDRAVQMGALGMLRRAAAGQAPSRAAALSQLATQDAIRSGTAGTGGALRAMRASQGTTANQMNAANSQAMDMRAAESARDVGAYGGAGNAIRGQDLQYATTNAQLDATNRDLEERRQEAYERMAWQTRNAQVFANNEVASNDANAALNQRKLRAAQAQADYDKAKDVASVGVAGAMALSDERAKQRINPVGSLARLMRCGRG